MAQRRSEYNTPGNPLTNIWRTVDFWARTSTIYTTYKLSQLKVLQLKREGKDDEYIAKEVWDVQHTWAGEQMYNLCVDLRGFYLKVCS
jgi:hypothetical protein